MSLSLNDGKATPVAHVFTQDVQQQGTDPALYVNRANANGPSFWERLTALVTIPNRKAAKAVYKFKLSRPIPGIDAMSQPIVKGEIGVVLTILADQAVANESDILDSLVMAANLCNNATVRSQVKQLAPSLIP